MSGLANYEHLKNVILAQNKRSLRDHFGNRYDSKEPPYQPELITVSFLMANESMPFYSSH